MKRVAFPLVLLAIAQVIALLTFYYSTSQLPARMAAHFNAAGNPGGWMNRGAYLGTMAALSVGMTLFVLAIFYAVRIFPNSMINLPHRDYWLSPERREQTCNALFRYGIWLAFMMTGFLFAMHMSIIAANARNPPNLASGIWINTVIFLIGIGVWSVFLLREFKKPVGRNRPGD